MSDVIAKIGHTVVHYGPQNDRIYVMKLSVDDMPSIVQRLHDLALRKSYSKILVKVPEFALGAFTRAGYVVEAYVPGFFHGRTGGYFMAKYMDGTRAQEKRKSVVDSVLSAARHLGGRSGVPALKEGLAFHVAGPEDARELAALYGEALKAGHSPIGDAAYILRTMETNVRYFCVRANGAIVGASSAHMDHDSGNVEMTDFATFKGYEGGGISAYLLQRMEENMAMEGMDTAYTIARATSYPLNKIFSRAGYVYAGKLTNNASIGGAYESMNVWYKGLC